VRLADYLDKGASLGPDAPCLTTDGQTGTYGEVRGLSVRIAAALARHGVAPGDTVAILSANDPVAFTCVFGISRAGAVWCPVNPRNEAAENRELLELFECGTLIFQARFAPLVQRIRAQLPRLHTLVCLDGTVDGALRWDEFLGPDGGEVDRAPVDDLAMIVGTGGTTGRPKGVLLTGTNLETMTAVTLMSYPFPRRPVYLALAPLTHAAGVLCFPVLALGGQIVVMRTPDVGAFLGLVERHRVSHTFLPPTLVYMVLDSPELDRTDLSSLRCFWYGAAPMSATRLEEALLRIGPVMAQLFGQTEAPMMISTMSPRDHYDRHGRIARDRLSSAGQPAPLVTVAVMAEDGTLLPAGERGEIVVRTSLPGAITRGYLSNPEATAHALRGEAFHTGDLGSFDADGNMYFHGRMTDTVRVRGENVSALEVEQVVAKHPAVEDCAMVGVKAEIGEQEIMLFVKRRAGIMLDAAALSGWLAERLAPYQNPRYIVMVDEFERTASQRIMKHRLPLAAAAWDRIRPL
jgi:fatty-acyl-CoA synthase